MTSKVVQGIASILAVVIALSVPEAGAQEPVGVTRPATGSFLATPPCEQAPAVQQFRGIYVGYPLPLLATTHAAAMPFLNRTPSPRTYHDQLTDHQRFAPVLRGQYLDGRNGLTIVFGDWPRTPAGQALLLDERFKALLNDTTPAAGDGAVFSLTATGDARADIVVDSARLNKPSASVAAIGATGFFPSLIPVRGDASYGLGARSTVFAGDGAGHLGLELNGNDAVSDIKGVAEISLFTQSNGQTTAQFIHAYGQAFNFIFGKTDSAFSDPHVFPNVLDINGPNAEVNLQHPMLAYLGSLYSDSPTDPQVRLNLELSLEFPEANATALDSTANSSNWFSRSRIPDFAGNIHLIDKSWGHLQVAAVVRDIGIENQSYTESVAQPFLPKGTINSSHEDVFGWGVHVTGGIHPFKCLNECHSLAKDRVSFGYVCGTGVGNYITDLRALGGYDAMYNTLGQLKAIHVQGYWAGYTHHWTDNLTSTVIYSEVDADTFKSPGFVGSPYRRGTYVAANLIYAWNFVKAADPAVPGSKAHTSYLYTGVEFLYGQRETLNGAIGCDQRVQATIGLKY
jgi:hypothetical protein